MNHLARVAALAVMAALLVSCGDDEDPLAPDPNGNALVFTRADQSPVQFPEDSGQLVWCGPWEDGEVDTPSLRILFYGPEADDPSWALQAVIADVTLGQPLSFPNSFVFDEPKDVAIILVDPPSNELSTQDDESSGSITFHQLDCGSGGEVRFEIDAVIGSEFSDGPPVHVTGTFRAPIGEAPQFSVRAGR